jgi:hypothetical protein
MIGAHIPWVFLPWVFLPWVFVPWVVLPMALPATSLGMLRGRPGDARLTAP